MVPLPLFRGGKPRGEYPGLTKADNGRVDTKAKTKEVNQMNRLIQAAFTAPCTGNTKLVLVGMAHGDEEGQRSYTSAEIAFLIGCDQSTVSRAISKLIDMGFVSKTDDRKYRLSIAKCNEQIAKCNEQIAKCNEQIAKCNEQIAKCNEQPHERKENLPPNSASLLLPPTPPIIITSNTLDIPPSEEKKSDEAKAIGESEGGFAALPPSDLVFSFRAIAMEASSRLIANGLSADEAIYKIKAIKAAFLDKAKSLEASGDLATKNNPIGYLVGMLTSMALEGPKPQAEVQPQSPRDLAGIFAALREYYKTVYPNQSGHIDSIVSEDSLSPRTIATLKAKEAQGWPQVSTPQGWVQSLIDGEVFSQLEAAKADDITRATNHLITLRRRLADKQAERIVMAQDGNTKCLPELDKHIARLNLQIQKLERELKAA